MCATGEGGAGLAELSCARGREREGRNGKRKRKRKRRMEKRKENGKKGERERKRGEGKEKRGRRVGADRGDRSRMADRRSGGAGWDSGEEKERSTVSGKRVERLMKSGAGTAESSGEELGFELNDEKKYFENI